MTIRRAHTFATPLLLAILATAQAPFAELTYRNIGPSRGGRVTAVAGVAQQPGTFYLGASGGGVWKTTDFGHRWRNVSDGFITTPSIGAITVAPSAPETVWVGTGSDGLRSNVIRGRGVFRSDDGGRSWRDCGLHDVGQIGAIVVDPNDPDIAFVAAIGNAFAPNEDRGVYRTRDGGESWQRVFHISKTCGCVDLELHPANPEVVYAAMWQAERKPWTIRSGGREGGIWRSEDGGATWHKLGGGLPDGVVGKSDLAVSRVEPDRLWVLMEALERPGLYRSDDAGQTFTFVSNQRGLLDRPFYYCNVDCDPSDADHLFISATSWHESRDGGNSWRRRSTPHGDNHEVWIHPDHPQLMVQCNDGGANVSTDGGATWSRQDNQTTAELYQVAVDDRFPYWLYAGQQDNSTIRVPSRPPYPATGGAGSHWQAVGGCETGPVVPKPGNADIVYANCKGRFGVYDHRTGQERQYYVGAESLYGHNPKDLLYRFQRVAPITISPHDPNRVYHGSQFLHATEDGGATWRTLSPDLTAFAADKQVVSGEPITRDITGEEYYSTLYEIAESPVQRGVIWTGANDGPIHVTRDDGEHWHDVTPPMPNGGRVQTIEPSWHAAGTAYACVLRYQLGDPRPYVFKTEDFGTTWRKIVDGLPDDCPTRVVREDPHDPQVLFCGTEWGMFVSVDAGASWRPFQQNLPVTPVTDIVLHEDDLVLSTMGRAFWILDDISAVRSMRTAAATTPTLLPPRTTVRARLAGHSATLHYVLPRTTDGLRIEIRSAQATADEPLRILEPGATRPTPRRRQGMRAPPAPAEQPARDPGNGPGLHRITWDMRQNGAGGARRGPLVPPGDYEIRLVWNGGEHRQQLTLTIDPRVAATGVTNKDLQAQARLLLQVQQLAHEANTLAASITRRIEQTERDDERADRLLALQRRLDDERITYPQGMLRTQIRYLQSMLDRADQRPGQDAYARLEQLQRQLAEVRAEFARLD